MENGWKKVRAFVAGVCLVACVSAVTLWPGCGDDEPEQVSTSTWTPPPPDEYRIPDYAKYLSGVKVCLDPGHGGRAHRKGYKRGPTGVREAEINLRVALCLRDFLKRSGAVVFMTRTEDVFLASNDQEDLRLRAEMANRNECDIFLSIHHNAGSREAANFTSVWYHAEIDESPASIDIADCLAIALIDHLDLPETMACPVMSDEQMYPRGGFAVLRQAKVPAVLSEASFFSNPQEEQRLSDPAYNQREAYALFLGLARYAYRGIPRTRLVEPANGVISANEKHPVLIELDDGISSRKGWGSERRLIYRDSIVVRLDGKDVPFDYSGQTDEHPDRISVRLPSDLSPGRIAIQVRFQNLFKQANMNPFLGLQVTR